MPVVVLKIQREHPDIDPALIASKVSDEQLLSLAHFAPLFITEAKEAGIDLEAWRQQIAQTSSPNPPDAVAQPASLFTEGLQVPTSESAASDMRITQSITPVPSSIPPGSSVEQVTEKETDVHRIGDRPLPSQTLVAPAGPNRRLPKVLRTLCIMQGSNVLKTSVMSFELTDAERDSVARWALRYQDVECVYFLPFSRLRAISDE